MKTTTSAKQFESFKKDVRKLLGASLVGEVGPAQGQYGFCTTEPDLGETAKARSIDAIVEAKDRYPALERCPVMPFAARGKIVYVIAGLARAGL